MHFGTACVVAAVLTGLTTSLAALEITSANNAWPLAAGTIRIYEGTFKWTGTGKTSGVNSRTMRWTNEVEWSAVAPRTARRVSVVRGSVHHLALDEPNPAAPPTVFVIESNRVYQLHVANDRAAYQLACTLLDSAPLKPVPREAMEQLRWPLEMGSDFDVDLTVPPRSDHYYCWHVEKKETRRLHIKGFAESGPQTVITLAYRTLPDHQIVEFVPGLGVIHSESVHHGTIGEVRLRLVEYHDGRTKETDPIGVSPMQMFGDVDCFRISTPVATYFYGRRGAGFASILDPDGHDWISYRHGDKARGEYRGLPKCGQPIKYFHCGYGFGQYTNDNPFMSTITRRTPRHLQIRSETLRRDATCEWDFYPTHATLTLQRCGTNAFWFLYEGTPGGALQVTDDWSLRPERKRVLLDEPWEGAASWVAFGAAESPWSFWMRNHDPSTALASYVPWPYKPESDGGIHQMTVFGWGRLGWQDPRQHTPQLTRLPATFSIGFVQGSIPSAIEQAVAVQGR